MESTMILFDLPLNLLGGVRILNLRTLIRQIRIILKRILVHAFKLIVDGVKLLLLVKLCV